MIAEIYCNKDGTISRISPYDEGFYINFNDYGPAMYDMGLAEFPENFRKYEKWGMKNRIFIILAFYSFKDDFNNYRTVPILQFTSLEDAMAFKLVWT